jgi:ketosteroid isomerase-like protein
MTALEIVTRFYRALESGLVGDDLLPFWADDVVTTEYPNLISPKGGTAGLAEMKAASERGAGLLASQKYDILDAYDVGETAIVRLTWTGVVAQSVGPFESGQVLTAHIAQFVRSRGEQLISIATYDCYESFSA